MPNCPNCQTEFSKDTTFCQKCGCNLAKEFIISPICPKCHAEFPDGTKFCNVDGSHLTTKDKLVPKCVICGVVYPPEVKFCVKDGGPVIAEAYRQAPQQASQPRVIINGASGRLIVNGVNLGHYPKADLGKRFGASLLDGLASLMLAIPAILFFLLSINEFDSYRGDDDLGALYVLLGFLLLLIPIGYTFFKDGLSGGASWGKKAAGIMVVSLDANLPCTQGKSFLRGLIMGLLGIIPIVGWLIEPIMVLADQNGRRLGDKAANTQVINKEYYVEGL